MSTVSSRSMFKVFGVFVVAVCVVFGTSVWANPPKTSPPSRSTGAKSGAGGPKKHFDQPNPADFQERMMRLDAMGQPGTAKKVPAKSGTDRILVILVEFGGSDTFTFTPGVSTWDPYAKSDYSEATGAGCDCANIVSAHAELTGPKSFTYSGPLHNQIPRPLSAADESGDSIWTTDFSHEWYEAFLFGDGVTFNYDREDSSHVSLDFTGKSVRHYYEDMSGGAYTITGDVVGWIQVPHSTWYYGADCCPGALSGGDNDGSPIPEGGSPRDLVSDALAKVNELYPGFNWQQYDQDGDGIIDRLWIVHAGYGEEESGTTLNRTDYGESAIWSHSSSLTPSYEVDATNHISAGPYIIMPENGGIGVFAHEFGHNLGAIDLYDTDNYAETSAGFWTLMCDDWTGYPIGFMPPAMDPWHLDTWGWLNPLVVSDPAQVYEVNVGQASEFPGGADTYRGVRIQLADGLTPHPVSPNGVYQWWGGNRDQTNSEMTLITPVALPASPAATLSFNVAWDLEDQWDFLWIQLSTDNGANWHTLTNADTICNHVSDWIGGEYDFPNDLCAAGIGGFTGQNGAWPNYTTELFDLSAYAGNSVLIRFWYMTDWGTTYSGPFVDDIHITADSTDLFTDDAEAGAANWQFDGMWNRVDANRHYAHNYYLQWRNVNADGGYDSSLGNSLFRYGPANTGLVVWYNNNLYTNNNLSNYLTDDPGFGSKGAMLVVDAHPDPYRDPYWVANGYNNEGGNVTSRSQMRDAPFSLFDSVPFSMNPPAVFGTDPVAFTGRTAVNMFQDSLGYYPGAEFIRRGPGYADAVATKWLTVQWDASVVMPATDFYGIKAPGYTGDQEFRYDCSRYPDGKLSAYWFGPSTGIGYDGGTGNPADAPSGPAQYGWNVRVISQTNKTAHLGIWNSLYTAEPNFKPVMDAIANQNVAEAQLLEFTVSATDPNPANTLTFSASNLPEGATFDPATATFSWTPGYAAAGTYDTVTFTATDNGTPVLSDSKTITITVANTNRAPDLTAIGNKQIKASKTLSFTVVGTDPDTDPLTYTSDSLPAGATLDPATGVFSWKPTDADVGDHAGITITVQDNGTPPLTDTETITISVSEAPKCGLFRGSLTGPGAGSPFSRNHLGDTLLIAGALLGLVAAARRMVPVRIEA